MAEPFLILYISLNILEVFWSQNFIRAEVQRQFATSVERVAISAAVKAPSSWATTMAKTWSGGVIPLASYESYVNGEDHGKMMGFISGFGVYMGILLVFA